MTTTASALVRIRELAGEVARAGGAFAGEAAAHVHLAAATGAVPGGPDRYLALPPRRIEAVLPGDADPVPGVDAPRDAVADLARGRLDLLATAVTLTDGTPVPVLSREVVVAELLAQGGLSVALVGRMVRLSRAHPIDIDEVRDLLKAAGRGESFQPLLEIIAVA